MFGFTKVLPFLGKRRCIFPLPADSKEKDYSTPTEPMQDSKGKPQNYGTVAPQLPEGSQVELEHSKVIENVKKELEEQSKRLKEESEKRRKQNLPDSTEMKESTKKAKK